MANNNYQMCNEEIKNVVDKYSNDVDVISLVGNKADNHGAMFLKVDGGFLSDKGQAMTSLLNHAIMEDIEAEKGRLVARHRFTDLYLELMRNYPLETKNDAEDDAPKEPLNGDYPISYCLAWQNNIKNVTKVIHEKEKEGKLPKVRPCPHCEKDEAQTTFNDGKWTVVCGNCFYESEPQDSERIAIVSWNRQYYKEVIAAKEKEEQRTFEDFSKAFEELCKKFGYVGSVAVKRNPEDDNWFSWCAMKDENSSDEYRDLQLLMVESGMNSLYSFYDDEDMELASEKIIETFDEARRKHLEYVLWSMKFKKYMKEKKEQENK